MGLHYGPAHQGVVAVDLGEGQLLARLRLPEAAAGRARDYVLHPSLLDSALQASIGLIPETPRALPGPPVPFALESLRVLAPCAPAMVAWVRGSRDGWIATGTLKADIDLCDPDGNVCVELRGFTSRTLERVEASAGPGIGEHAASASALDAQLLADVIDRKLSIDEAVQRGAIAAATLG
jgi:hypothetical protein